MKQIEFNIKPIKFNWGNLLSDIRSQLSNIPTFENDNKYSSSQSLRVQIKNFLGIPINSVVFSSPYQDRIVNSIRFNLSTDSKETNDIVQLLNDEFGTFNESGNSENFGTGSVPEYYRWKLSNCDIGLSIYGGARDEFGEQNKGMIWVYLRDIELISKLYSNQLNLKSSAIDTETTILKKFKTKEAQKQSHYLEKDNYKNYDADYISIALNSYMKREIMLSPSILKTKLKEAELAIFKVDSKDQLFLGNKFECIELTDIDKFNWDKIHPAKGPGSNWLEINDFVVRDIYKSNAIEKITQDIQKVIACKLQYSESHDC